MCSLTLTVDLTQGHWLNRAGGYPRGPQTVGWAVPLFVPPTATFSTIQGHSLNRGEGHKRPESLHQLTWYYVGLLGQIGAVHNYRLGPESPGSDFSCLKTLRTDSA